VFQFVPPQTSVSAVNVVPLSAGVGVHGFVRQEEKKLGPPRWGVSHIGGGDWL